MFLRIAVDVNDRALKCNVFIIEAKTITVVINYANIRYYLNIQ